MLKKTDPQIIYDFFAEGGIGDLRLEDYFAEKPLGQGNVDFAAYMKALSQIGYEGFLTVEREVGKNPERDIQDAVNYLKKLMR
jgi:sugar phosphate isomerase/epimerase